MIHWLGHASFRIDGSKVIFTDPWEVSHAKKADIILITHSHFDHLSLPDIQALSTAATTVVAPEECRGQLPEGTVFVKPNEKYTVQGVSIETVRAYNIDKEFHPQNNHWVGYIITLNGKRIYQSGDTDVIPEMKHVRCDVALLPVGGTYTMNSAEAAKACELLQCPEAIPMHWGKIVGSRTDAEEFVRLCPKTVKARILEKE